MNFTKKNNLLSATAILAVTILLMIGLEPGRAAGDDNLLEAVQRGDLNEVKRLLERGADPNRSDSHGRSPIYMATWEQDCPLSSYILDCWARKEDGRKLEGPMESYPLNLTENEKESLKKHRGIKVEPEKENSKTLVVRDADIIWPKGAGMRYVKMDFVQGRVPGGEIKETARFSKMWGLLDDQTEMIGLRSLRTGKAKMLPASEMVVLNRGFDWVWLLGARYELVKLLLDKGAKVDTRGRYGETLLMWTCRRGFVGMTELLLQRGAGVNQVSPKRYSALDIACALGHANTARILLDHGADANVRDDKGLTPLIRAAQKGHVDLVDLLLEKGALLDARDSHGWSALMWATWEGRTDVVSRLKAHGASWNLVVAAITGDIEGIAQLLSSETWSKDGHSHTALALMGAARNGHGEAIQLLLDYGLDINDQDSQGQTALMTAASYGQNDILRLILDRNVNPDLQDNSGWTALMWAVRRGQRKAAQVLLQREVNPNLPDNKDCRTPLMYAASQGDISLVKLLLSGGADITATDKHGQTAYRLASFAGHADIMKMLETRGAYVKSSDLQKDLTRSARIGNISMVKQLIAQGVDVNAKMEEDMTPLMWAARNGHADVVTLLLEHGAQVDTRDRLGRQAVHLCIGMSHIQEKGSAETTKALLDGGANVESKDQYGRSLLMLASSKGDLPAVKVLLERGANINATTKEGWSPLMMAGLRNHQKVAQTLKEANAEVNLLAAAMLGDVAQIKLLLDRGADVNERDVMGTTPVIWAAHNGQTETVKLLLDRGAGIDAADHMGTTALVHASANGHIQTVRMLVERGADPNKKSQDDDTAMSIAKRRHYGEIIEILKAHGAKE
jgi:serine/threonine-protein phosphatase 6 regulatory ankyrin repeat subunit B